MLFQKVVAFCYSSQTVVCVSSWIIPIITWHICQTIVDCLALIATICVLNQSKGHWVVSDALNSAITISSKLKEEIGKLHKP